MYRSRFQRWDVKKNSQGNRIAQPSRTASTAISETTVDYQVIAIGTHVRSVEIQPSSSIIIQPSLPNSLYIPDKLLYLLRSYVRGSSEALHWPRDSFGSFLNEDVVRSWCSPLMSAAWVVKEGDTRAATLLLGQFLDQCHQQLERKDPLIFVFIYTSVLFFATKYPGTAIFLLFKLHSAARGISDPAVRPLCALIRVLCQLGPEGIVQHARTTLFAYIDFIQTELGAAYPLIQDMTSDAVMRLLAGRLISSEAAVTHISQMISAVEQQGWQRCRYFLQLKMNLSKAYLQMGEAGLADARQMAEQIMQDQYADCRDNGIVMDYHTLICNINEAEGYWNEARLSALRAVATSIMHFGEHSDWAVNTLILYRNVLERMGEYEEAQMVAKDRDLVVAKLCQLVNTSISLGE